MAAITRWVKYNIDAVGAAGDGDGAQGLGTRGFSLGRGTVDLVAGIDIGPTTDRLYINIDGFDVNGGAPAYIALASGTDLDPRYIARDITEKLLASAPTNEIFANAVCVWEGQYWGTDPNINGGNRFKIYSGSLGSSSSVTVATSGTNSAHSILGWDTKTETGGSASANDDPADPYVGVSGTYNGFLHETYHVVISNDTGSGWSETRGIDTPVKSISYDGTATFEGLFNGAADDTYTITINVDQGTTMGGGSGQVPRMRWTSTNDSMAAGQYVELLYPNHWYSVGSYGVRVKFTDAVFAAGFWTLSVYSPDYAQGSNNDAAIGTAQYIYSSTRGDDSASPTTTVSGGYTALGTKGLYITFSGSNNLYAGDEFYIICAGPYPGDTANYDISNLNYGNVTVASDSDVKSVMFEIKSGAEEMLTVKFGLQNHGTFNHHDENNLDTRFKFGTVGPANPKNGYEWRQNVTATDINTDSPPAYLFATKADLAVVSTADASESIGNTGLVSDPMWVAIFLGASETGANSTINYRLYFDYS